MKISVPNSVPDMKVSVPISVPDMKMSVPISVPQKEAQLGPHRGHHKTLQGLRKACKGPYKVF
jgi:hypothetical protein